MPDTVQPESHISQLLRSRIDEGDFPSAVYIVAEAGDAVFSEALGNSVVQPTKHAATLETIYDLASLTKPLVTGLLCAQLFESGAIHLDDPVSMYLEEFNLPDKQSI